MFIFRLVCMELGQMEVWSFSVVRIDRRKDGRRMDPWRFLTPEAPGLDLLLQYSSPLPQRDKVQLCAAAVQGLSSRVQVEE